MSDEPPTTEQPHPQTCSGGCSDILKRISGLAEELVEVSHTQRSMFCEPVRMVSAHLARTIRAFHDRLAEHVKAALGVSLSPGEFSFDVREPAAPPVDVSYAFDVAFSTLSHVMPAVLCRRPVERMLLRKARYEVEKNLSRLAADWNKRVGVVIEALCQQAEQAAQSELRALNQMAVQPASNVSRLREQVAELERLCAS